MSKKENIFKLLDTMVINLNEEKRRLGVAVKTGQLTNPERHDRYNQFYVKTLSEVTEQIISPTS